jgi:hypothetical protein
MTTKTLLVLIGLMPVLNGMAHPLHISTTNLDFRPTTGKWELTIKIFSDDFEEALRLDMASKENITGWVNKQLMLYFDNQLVDAESFKLEEIRKKEDATWLRYTFKHTPPSSEVKVINKLLLNLYSDQKNLFIFTMGRFQSGLEFNARKTELTITLLK